MRRKSTCVRTCLAALAIARVSAPAVADTCALPQLLATPTRMVTRIIDAETLALDDGAEVRLAGVLAPHTPASAAPSRWPLEDEARQRLESAAQGRAVVVVTAPTTTRDRYGRILAQAYVADGNRMTWLQGMLLDAGLARATMASGIAVCDVEMRRREAAARDALRGLWSSPAYRTLRADDIRELVAHAGDFVIVEGRVAAAAAKSRRLYLNFGSDWRQDFTVAVPPAVMSREAEGVANLRSAAGKIVRVRGWIERRNGPLIEITSTSAVEVLEGANQGSVNDERPAEAQPGVVQNSEKVDSPN